MADAENNLQPSKKRTAGRQLSRDNPSLDDEDTSEPEMGTFKKASDEVMASRRVVKVRRNTTSSSSNTTAPSSNPFAGIRLAPPKDIQATPSVASTMAEGGKASPEKVDEKNDAKEETKENDKQPEADVSGAKSEPTLEKEKTDNVSNSEEIKSVDEKTAEGNNSVEEKAAEGNKSVDEKATKSNKSDEEGKKDEADNGDGETSKDAEEVRKNAEVENRGLETNKDVDDVKTDTVEEKEGGENVEKSAETSSFSSFQQLSSSQNAFTGLAGTGFSSSAFSFGSITKDGSGSLFGTKSDQPSFSFGVSSNQNSSLFGNSGASIVGKIEGTAFPSKQEVPIETGEENEKAVFTADSMLFEFLDGAWKERGKGELKVNVSTTETGKARLVMRTKGNYRLILNANLYPDMKLTNMEKKGITFACINSASEGKDGLSTYALKFKDASFVEEFRAAVTEHKGKVSVSPKTPENSPKAPDN